MDFKELLKETYKEDEVFAEAYDEFLHDSGELELNGLKLIGISNKRCNSDKIVIFSYDNKYYRIIGSYDSWNGTDFYEPCDVTEVKPMEKVVVEYVEVNDEN